MEQMNTKSLIKSVHTNTSLTYRQAEEAVRASIEALRGHISDGGEVSLKGLLQVKRVERKERVFSNYMTEGTTVPAHTKAKAVLSGPLAEASIRY